MTPSSLSCQRGTQQIGRGPLGSRLTEAFDSRVDFEGIEHVFVKAVDPSTTSTGNNGANTAAPTLVQENHIDCIPDGEQQDGKGLFLSTVMVIYLTEPTDDHPLDQLGALLFPVISSS